MFRRCTGKRFKCPKFYTEAGPPVFKYLEKTKKPPTHTIESIFVFPGFFHELALLHINRPFSLWGYLDVTHLGRKCNLFLNRIDCIKIKGKFLLALHFIIYYFYITWHLFRRPNSSVSLFLCEKKGKTGTNASKYSIEKHQWTYISGTEVKTRMLGTRNNHKFLYFNKSGTATAVTFRSCRSK